MEKANLIELFDGFERDLVPASSDAVPEGVGEELWNFNREKVFTREEVHKILCSITGRRCVRVKNITVKSGLIEELLSLCHGEAITRNKHYASLQRRLKKLVKENDSLRQMNFESFGEEDIQDDGKPE